MVLEANAPHSMRMTNFLLADVLEIVKMLSFIWLTRTLKFFEHIVRKEDDSLEILMFKKGKLVAYRR